MSWPEHDLGELVDLLTGYPFKSTLYIDDPSGVRLLRGDNVAQGALRWEDAKRWPASELPELSKFALAKADVILAMDRPWIAAGLKYARVTDADIPSLLVQRVARLRANERVDQRFLAYIIGSFEFTGYIKGITTGANVPHISGPDIQKFRFPLPPLPTQRRIASILSAYDDLIENNTKRIKILEEMARTIYRQWFVHFRFPGHERVKLVESSLGQIPEGWNTACLGDLLENHDSRRIPLSQIERADRQGVYPYYGASGIIDGIDEFIFDGRYLLIAEDGENLRSRKLPVAFFATGQFWVNNHAHVVRGRAPFTSDIVYLLMSELDINPYITGAAQPKLSQANLNRIPVRMPPAPLLELFTSNVEPMLALVDVLRAANKSLRQTRDLLLPRLISGEIDVDHLDLPEAP